MDQAFARSGLRHVERLHLCGNLARVIVDAGLVLLWNINHCDWCSRSLIWICEVAVPGVLNVSERDVLERKEVWPRSKRSGEITW